MPCRPVSRAPRAGFFAIGNDRCRYRLVRSLEGVDAVVHLAARVHVMRDTAADPLAAFRAANVEATVNLARRPRPPA